MTDKVRVMETLKEIERIANSMNYDQYPTPKIIDLRVKRILFLTKQIRETIGP